MNALSRRKFLATSALATAGMASGVRAQSQKKALIAISLDLEMARNFPNWNDTHWDYEKGNLNDAAKQYAVGAARRVKAHGGVIHFFLVASALEQENVDWLKEIRDMGHFIGNHTYDHVYIRAEKLEDVQFKFKRCPWLIAGKSRSRLSAKIFKWRRRPCIHGSELNLLVFGHRAVSPTA